VTEETAVDLDLVGKTAVVTGASKGIGLAVVRSLAAEGMNVVAGARGGSATRSCPSPASSTTARPRAP
jgi:NAD(P)-dependent dehydrogenase (short-subunit alcohol dehydrogenase family)